MAEPPVLPETFQQPSHLQPLNEIGRVVSATLDLRTLYDTIYTQVGRVMDTTHFFVALHRPDRDAIQVPYLREEGKLLLEQEMPYGNSVTSLVIDRGTPLLFNSDAAYAAYARENEVPVHVVGEKESEAKIYVPLNTGSRTIGALTVQSNRPQAYTEDDVRALHIIAAQAAVAIENARLYSEERNRVFELQTVQSIVQKLTPLHEIPDIAAMINRELKSLIDYHACRLFRLDAPEEMLIPIQVDDDEPFDLRIKVGRGLVGWIAQHGQSTIVPNTLKDLRVMQIVGTPTREESMIGAPLVYAGRVQGVITLSRLGVNQFDGNALRLLEIIAAQAAIAFDRARLYAELRTAAITDPMTGLYNRRYLLERFREEQSRAIRNKHTLAALMLDIDRFKQVNDRYGHDAGDVVLRELAGVIRAVVRAEDIVSRYGGEEFCVLLPEIPVTDAELVAERLRSFIEHTALPEAAGTKHVTVSVGMALLHPEDHSEELFTRADMAMYQVKYVGGNRVCIADGPTEFRLAEVNASVPRIHHLRRSSRSTSNRRIR